MHWRKYLQIKYLTNFFFGGGHLKDMTVSWPKKWTQGIGDPSPFLSLECTFCPPVPQWGCSQGCSLERALCFWDHLITAHDWTQLQFWQADGDIYSSCGLSRLTSFVSSFLLNLLPIQLERSASFLGFSLSCNQRGQFANQYSCIRTYKALSKLNG